MKNRIEIYTSGEELYSKLKFWCSGCGDLHYHGEYSITEDDLPASLKYAYNELWSEGSGCCEYLVDYNGNYYLVIEGEYDSDDENFLEAYTKAVVGIVELLSQNNDCKVIVNANHDSFWSKEIYFLLPAEMEKKELDKLEKQVGAALNCDDCENLRDNVMTLNGRYEKYFEISERAEKIGYQGSKLSLQMDIECADNYFGLDLEKWLNADDVDFIREIYGIVTSINRRDDPVNFGTFVPNFIDNDK